MKDERGITLIELVVTLGMMAGVVLIIYTFYAAGVRGFAKEMTNADNQLRVRRNSSAIAREIRRSDEAKDEAGKLALYYSNNEKKTYYLDGTVIKQENYEKNLVTNVYELKSDYNLVDGIKSFVINISGKKVTVTLESVENAEGETYKLVNKINIRE